jgi:hypothetical protein
MLAFMTRRRKCERRGVVEDADDEVLPPVVAGEEKEPAGVHAVVCEELRPPIAKVALSFAIIINFDAILGLANAVLLQRSVSHLLALHRLHEPGW